MKKLLYSLICLLLLPAVVSSCVDDGRKEILKVYNWGDYIDEDLIPEFEAWYEEQTGESVEIIYQTFDINEVMLAKIENGEADFDVVCPSEYIIERMMRKSCCCLSSPMSLFRRLMLRASTTSTVYHPSSRSSSRFLRPLKVATLTTTR